MSESIYILGHSQAEIRRLIRQAAILRSTTERLLQSAGIQRGMRVLDVGCGAGDVSMLAGQLVGASGSVIGIDLNSDILAVARERSQVDGFKNVTFTEASVGTFIDPIPFDLVIARYVLIHQVDPVAFPNVALWQQTADWICATFRARTPSCDAAGRLQSIRSKVGSGLPWSKPVAKSRGRRKCVRGPASDGADDH